jgi:phospholipid-binding lipoprotein MlaA
MLAMMSAMLLTATPVHGPAAPVAWLGATPSPFAGDFPDSASLPVLMPLSMAVSPLALVASLPAVTFEPQGVPTQTIPPVGPAPLNTPTTGRDIVVTGRKETAGDPLRAVNAESFAVTQKVDDAVIGPVARTYKKTVPSPIRRGIHNFLYNLREPIVFLNFLLQFKPGKAAETVGRFAINSTIGAVGVIDIAKRKPFHLPRRSNGFANTLGYYGVKNGAFLFLPLVGPTTIRDLFGGAIDRLILPVGIGKPFTSATYTIPAGILGALDHRSEFDQTLKDLHDNSPDPYDPVLLSQPAPGGDRPSPWPRRGRSRGHVGAAAQRRAVRAEGSGTGCAGGSRDPCYGHPRSRGAFGQCAGDRELRHGARNGRLKERQGTNPVGRRSRSCELWALAPPRPLPSQETPASDFADQQLVDPAAIEIDDFELPALLDKAFALARQVAEDRQRESRDGRVVAVLGKVDAEPVR